MPDQQLHLEDVAPPLCPGEAATALGGDRHTLAPGTASAPTPPRAQIPPRTSPHATLRGYCPYCGKWPKAGETTGKLFSHKPHHISDARAINQGRCNGSGARPTRYRWLEIK